MTASPDRCTVCVPGSTCTSPKLTGAVELVLHATRRGATEQRIHARQQLEQTERLRDVVVGAKVEAEDLVGLLAARAEDEHRRVDASSRSVRRTR